jgi:hypothetical protein
MRRQDLSESFQNVEYAKNEPKTSKYGNGNRTSPHILGTAANLLGFCLIVLTSLHFTNSTANTIIDELTSLIALLLTLSSTFSFISIRTKNEKMEFLCESIAEYLFIVSLIGIFLIILFLMIKYWLK